MLKTVSELPARMKVLMGVGCAAVAVLLAMGAVQLGRSALVYFSEDYVAEFAQTHIGVALTENGVIVEGDDALLQDPEAFLGGDAQMQVGKSYAEELSAANTTDMGEYVRLTVRKYWATEDGGATGAVGSPKWAKDPSLDPALIRLSCDSPDWVLNPAESTGERLVFYYKYLLGPGEAAATPAVSAVAISPDIAFSEDDFSRVKLALSAQVDSVQYRYAADAAKSAWGIDAEALGLEWQ